MIADAFEHLGKERVRLAVIERDVRRRPDHDDHLLPIEPELIQHPLVGAEIGEVVLLLETRVLEELLRAGAVPLKPLGRNRVGREHAPREAAADVVLKRRELVVEHVHRRYPKPPGGERQVVRSVSDREVESALSRESPGST